MQNNKSIGKFIYKSGFGNLSNFYKHFRKITWVIPKDFRARFQKSCKLSIGSPATGNIVDEAGGKTIFIRYYETGHRCHFFHCP